MDIAILGYGTVGSGTVTVLNRNRETITEDSGEVIRVKSILDLRDFPGDPYEERITHDFEEILSNIESFYFIFNAIFYKPRFSKALHKLLYKLQLMQPRK